jgi:hypothetical protein
VERQEQDETGGKGGGWQLEGSGQRRARVAYTCLVNDRLIYDLAGRSRGIACVNPYVSVCGWAVKTALAHEACSKADLAVRSAGWLAARTSVRNRLGGLRAHCWSGGETRVQLGGVGQRGIPLHPLRI